MTLLRRWPVTPVFWVVMACLDLAALANDHESKFADALVLGQLLIASGWLIVGRSARLARAGVWMAVLVAMTTPDFIVPRLRGGFYIDLVWPHVLGEFICIAVATAGATVCWLAGARLMGRGFSHLVRGPVRFSLLEILGWMMVVAVGSVGARLADFSLIGRPQQIRVGLAVVTLAGAVMALVLGDYNGGGGKRTALAAAIGVCLVAFAIGWLVKDLSLGDWPTILGGLACTVIWTAASYFDRARAGGP